MAPNGAQQHPQRRLPDRRLPRSPGRSARGITRELDLRGGRLRLGHLRLARPDRDDLRGRAGAPARGEGPAHARGPRVDDRCRRATPAAARTSSPTSRAAATSTSTTATGRSSPPPRATCSWWRSRADGSLRHGARLRPHRRRAERRQDHLGAARLLGPDLVRLGPAAWSARLDPATRRGALARAGRGDRQLVRRRTTTERVYMVTHEGPLPASRRRADGAPADDLARGLPQLGHRQAGPGARRARAPRPRSCRATGSRSPTTPTR